VSEHPHQAAEEERTEEVPAPPASAPGPALEERPEEKNEPPSASPLDMLFREAEVIARNLKESGTRR
jgi:hypothetical protein